MMPMGMGSKIPPCPGPGRPVSSVLYQLDQDPVSRTRMQKGNPPAFVTGAVRMGKDLDSGLPEGCQLLVQILDPEAKCGARPLPSCPGSGRWAKWDRWPPGARSDYLQPAAWPLAPSVLQRRWQLPSRGPWPPGSCAGPFRWNGRQCRCGRASWAWWSSSQSNREAPPTKAWILSQMVLSE